jgi:hypothetical protein
VSSGSDDDVSFSGVAVLLDVFEPDLKRLKKLNMAESRDPSGRRVG